MRTLRKLCRAAVRPISVRLVPVKAGQEPSERQAKHARHRCGRPIGAAGRAKAIAGPWLAAETRYPDGSSHGSINRFRASRAFLSLKSARAGRQGARVPALHREPNPGVALQARAVLQPAFADRRPVSATGRMGVCFVSPFNILTFRRLPPLHRQVARSSSPSF